MASGKDQIVRYRFSDAPARLITLGVALLLCSALMFAFCWAFTLTDPSLPNYYAVKLQEMLRPGGEGMIPVTGLFFSTTLVATGIVWRSRLRNRSGKT